ncbi:MAG: ribosome silencing factor [Alphaproteobacteria bacterium]|nr:ribosome silencing factor [Alphaproteobacteria bacterium]
MSTKTLRSPQDGAPLDLILNSLEDDKAEDPVVIDLTGKTTIADKMVIATGRSQRQVGAMAEHVTEKLKAIGNPPLAVEGMANCDWVLIDAGDVIVHLFRPEVRSFYNLEKLWGGFAPAPQVSGRDEVAPVSAAAAGDAARAILA